MSEGSDEAASENSPATDLGDFNGSFVKVPNHVAIIMDGNARWARSRGLTVAEGHRSGYSNIRKVVSTLRDRGVAEVTLFAFSTENWQRPEEEVGHIMALASEAVANDVEEFHKRGVKLRHVGSDARIRDEMREMIRQAEDVTSSNGEFSLNLAFDYGGREDILNATRRMIRDGITAESVDEALFSRYLYTAGCSDPDLIIRTGGEFRISNFLLWQSAYAEFHSTETLWPDFDDDDVSEAFALYANRHRRFGRRPS